MVFGIMEININDFHAETKRLVGRKNFKWAVSKLSNISRALIRRHSNFLVNLPLGQSCFVEESLQGER